MRLPNRRRLGVGDGQARGRGLRALHALALAACGATLAYGTGGCEGDWFSDPAEPAILIRAGECQGAMTLTGSDGWGGEWSATGLYDRDCVLLAEPWLSWFARVTCDASGISGHVPGARLAARGDGLCGTLVW